MSSNLLNAGIKTGDSAQGTFGSKSVSKSPGDQSLGGKIAEDIRGVFKSVLGGSAEEPSLEAGLKAKIEEALKAGKDGEQIESLKALVTDKNGNVSQDKLQELLAIMESKGGIDTAKLEKAITSIDKGLPSLKEVLSSGDKEAAAFSDALTKGDKKALELKEAIESGEITLESLEKALAEIADEKVPGEMIVKAPKAVEETPVDFSIELSSIGNTPVSPSTIDVKATGNIDVKAAGKTPLDLAKNVLSENRISNVDTSKFVDMKQPGSEGKSETSILQALMASKAVGKGIGQTGPQSALQVLSGGQVSSEATSVLTDGLTQLKTSAAEWSPINLKSNQGQWGKDLAAALGDRLTMQINQNVKEASVRLDPPDLGRIDLSIKVDGDRMLVSMNSNNAQVRDLINQHLDRLRGELEGQNGQKLEVSVGDGRDSQNNDKNSGSGNGQSQIVNAEGAEDENPESVSMTTNTQWLDTRA